MRSSQDGLGSTFPSVLLTPARGCPQHSMDSRRPSPLRGPGSSGFLVARVLSRTWDLGSHQSGARSWPLATRHWRPISLEAASCPLFLSRDSSHCRGRHTTAAETRGLQPTDFRGHAVASLAHQPHVNYDMLWDRHSRCRARCRERRRRRGRERGSSQRVSTLWEGPIESIQGRSCFAYE